MTLTVPIDPEREDERHGEVSEEGDIKKREGRSRKKWAGLWAKACSAPVN